MELRLPSLCANVGGGSGASDDSVVAPDSADNEEEVTQIRAWRQASQPWFDHLRLEKNSRLREQLSLACRYYAFHLDRYLNSGCGGRAVPLRDIRNHFADEIDGKNKLQWTVVHAQEPNDKCVGVNPFALFEGQTSADFVDYLDLAESICRQMDCVFHRDEASFRLQQPLVVYRGLRMCARAVIDPRFAGYSSTSSTRDNAFSIMLGGGRPFDAKAEQAVLMRVTLPRGARVINMNLCTIQEENEVLVLAQGRLVQTGRETSYLLKTWREVDKRNGVFEIRVRVIDYTLHVTADKPPMFKQININDK